MSPICHWLLERRIYLPPCHILAQSLLKVKTKQTCMSVSVNTQFSGPIPLAWPLTKEANLPLNHEILLHNVTVVFKAS